MTGGAAPGRKGAYYERAVVAFLKTQGFLNAERRPRGMHPDIGDVTGVPETVIECKNQRALDLGAWFSQMEREQFTAEEPYGALFIKRRGCTDVGHHYVVVSGYTWAALMAIAVGAEPPPDYPEGTLI